MKVLVLILLSASIILTGGVGLLRWGHADPVEIWESRNKEAFRVRVLKYPEKGDLLIPGAYYVFQSAPAGLREWKEIMTFRHDDPVSIPHDQVRFVNDKTGYVFMGWKYAVTTDGATTWSVWDAAESLPGWKCCHYKLIKDVRLEADGRGVITLSSDVTLHGVTKLYTRDYGRHWGKEQ